MPSKHKDNNRYFLVIGSGAVGKLSFIDKYLAKQKIDADCTDENDNVKKADSENEEKPEIKEEKAKKSEKREADELPGAITDDSAENSPRATPDPEPNRSLTPDPFFTKKQRQVIFYKSQLSEETVEDLVEEIKTENTEFGKLHALIIMFATSDPNSFGMARRFADECKRQKVNLPRVIVENKVDLLTNEDATERVPQVDEYVKKQKLRLYRSSALENFQVVPAVDYLAKKCEKMETEKTEQGAGKKKKKSSMKRKGSAKRLLKSMSKFLNS